MLYIQAEELKGIEWALNYPGTSASAPPTIDKGGCNRTPACGYPPKTVDGIYGKVLRGKAVIVDGEMDVLPGVKIHPAHRAHTAGSQLLEVPTPIGKLVFGSDAYSSWEAIRDWEVANSSRPTRCSSSWPTRSATRSPAAIRTAWPRTSRCPTPTSTRSPRTHWVGMNGGRLAEVALAPGEPSRKK